MTSFSLSRSLFTIALITSISQLVYANNDIALVHTNFTPSYTDACTEKKAVTPAVMPAPVITSTPVRTPASAPFVATKEDEDGDGVIDLKDQCPHTPHGYKVDPDGCPRSVTLHIQFVTGKSTLLPSSDKDVKMLTDFMVENPASKITIIGHTDNVGKKKPNQILSEARSKALESRLIQNGIEKERITTSGKGMSEPIASNKTSAGKALNRRIEIKIN